ncbi:ArsR/SmtB family transcription factor [Neobacillus vireti]|uniref:ArsR family transcriptional regulator n=1 Tax=Neobacillus vireti LMG 21834 TaxID=1131730 RepID=A0AB94IMU0_9BACI|nr:metalloregulator ArsR/SmtB family transcription factor [Neobacillus vireti]ETI68322.1 ArsR family transcriptional regulator [Neobacillus vireti LMG 21834]KLT16363.1 ArsR family transcriptional regulator [Neobacillus vireti]
MEDLNLWLKKHVRIIYSPFRELITSLHVLSNPAHHLTRQEWAEKMKRTMSPEIWDAVSYFGQISNEWLNFLDLDDYLQLQEKHVEESIERLKQLSTDDFLSLLLGKRAHISTAASTLVELEVHEKPLYFREKLCDFLYEYHQNHFARELFRVEPWLIKSVYDLKSAFEVNPCHAMNKIHPRFKLDLKSVRFYKAETWIFSYEEINTLTVYPSSFIAPHLLVGLEAPHIIVYMQVPLPDERMENAVPEDLLSILSALGDRTRMKLLKLMHHHPYCTQQLTDSTGLAKATISKHLKTLEKSGLITGERHGYFVFYQANENILDQLKVDLNQFFDQPYVGYKEET